VILKFWLNVSKGEQRKRLVERIDEPKKHWKFNFGDVDERERWEEYLDAYQHALSATSRPWAPWYAVPADDKHFMRWQVAKLVNDAFEQLDVRFPQVDKDTKAALKEAKERLLVQKD
jgi:polyphosphate kinase 2 (PPK2 family)